MTDKQIELLNDMRTEEGNYKLGYTVYDKEGNLITEECPECGRFGLHDNSCIKSE